MLKTLDIYSDFSLFACTPPSVRQGISEFRTLWLAHMEGVSREAMQMECKATLL